jgi:hypothetical protein
MKEKSLQRFFAILTLFMSATLLYGGYQIRQEADKKSDYEKTIRQKAVRVNMTLCDELERGSYMKGAEIENPLTFLRVCAEEL